MTTPKDWVKARAECNIFIVFDMLHRAVIRDTESANKHIGDACRFKVIPGKALENKDAFYVQRIELIGGGGNNPDTVNFVRGDKKIIISRPEEKKTLCVSADWDSENAECVFKLDQKPMDAQQISQRALEELFFPS